MKILFLAFVFLIIAVSAKANELKGSVKQFTGRTIETHHIYSYFALETEDNNRIVLPSWIDSKMLSKMNGHEIIVEGELEYLACTEMSRACPTAEIKKVQWLQYQNPNPISSEIVYTGRVKRFSGVAVESDLRYNYVALKTEDEIIEIPAFLNAEKLHALNPQVTLIGKTETGECAEMSEACGPKKLRSLSLIKLELK